MKINKHIEIVRSNSTGLSSLSRVSCAAIFTVLAKHYTKVGVTIVDRPADLEHLVCQKPDLVFIGMKFVLNGKDRIWLSDFLDEHDIAYTGSTQTAHALEYDKSAAKQRVIEAGLASAPFCVIKQADTSAIHNIKLSYPLFVKPLNRGGGQGIDEASVAHNQSQLYLKVKSIAGDLASDSLIEEYLPGCEYSVAIFRNELRSDFSVMPLQLIAPESNGVRLLSGKVKSANAELAVQITDLAIKSRIEDLALNSFYVLGARDYGRIDIRLGKDGEPNFLEANLIPSLISGYGSFPKACVMNIGLGYEAMILRIVGLALNRHIDINVRIKPAIAFPILEAQAPA